MNRKLRGSFTIEAAVIVPVILTVFSLIVTMLFYFHDKNVVSAVVHETLVMGCSKEEITTEELEQYLKMRSKKKLLLFEAVRATAEIDGEEITIVCTAKEKGMSLHVEMIMEKTDPEKSIWKLRRIGGTD